MIEDLTDEQGAVALPGCPISPGLPTITSLATAQIPRVGPRNIMAVSGTEVENVVNPVILQGLSIEALFFIPLLNLAKKFFRDLI